MIDQSAQDIMKSQSLVEIALWLLNNIGPIVFLVVIIFSTKSMFSQRLNGSHQNVDGSKNDDTNSNELADEETEVKYNSMGYFSKLNEQPAAVFLAGVVFIYFAIAVHTHEGLAIIPTWSTISDFSKEMGYALIISYFITVGIEKISREEHNKRVDSHMQSIKKNVFESIFYRNHDERIINMINESILNQPFYKTKYGIDIKIRYLNNKDFYDTPSQTDPVLVSVTLEMTVKNTSPKDGIYQIKAFVEKPYFHEYEKYVKIKNIEVDGISIGDQALIEADKAYEDTDDFVKYKKNTEIPKNGFKNIKIEYEFVKFARDEIAWRTVDPCGNMSVYVDCPPGIHSYCTQMHSNDDIQPSRNASGTLTIKIREPLFPHNGVLIWWAPISMARKPAPPKTERGAEGGDELPCGAGNAAANTQVREGPASAEECQSSPTGERGCEPSLESGMPSVRLL